MIQVRRCIVTRIPLLVRSLSTTACNHSGKPASPLPAIAGGEEDEEAYRRVHDLDFMMAVKILVTTPPKRKQFGLNFHLVQLFFACLPSLAVYLVAQYARYEIRRMEAEVELKKKQAEVVEDKAKEAELSSAEVLPADSNLSKIIVRLDALEQSVSDSKRDQVTGKILDPQFKSTANEAKTESDKEKANGSSPTLILSDGSEKNKRTDI